MLLERSPGADGHRWRALSDGPAHASWRVSAGSRHAVASGVVPRGMREWLRQRLDVGGPAAALVAETYERWEGHYALACWSDDADALAVGTDPFGIAKVYLHHDGERRRVGTDARGVMRAASATPLELDPGAVASFLATGYTPGRHTLHRGFAKLAPGTVLELRGGADDVIRSYLRIDGEPTLSRAAHLRAIREAWEASLRRYLDENDELPVALSGGIDSTTLVAALLALGADPRRLRTCTAVSVGGPDGQVLNPYDVEFSRRVAKDLGVRHQEVRYDWRDPRVGDDLRAVVPELPGEDGVGALLFRAVAREAGAAGRAMVAAQNADSLLSFTLTGRPTLRRSRPFVIGLGGWAGRHALFTAGARPSRAGGWGAGMLMDAYLRRRCGARWSQRTAADRMLGLAYNSHKWPWFPREELGFLRDPDALAVWFEREYVVMPGRDRHLERHPHAAFVALFLDSYMQGRDNRATVWPTTLEGAPTHLPFATLAMLRATAGLKPDAAFAWMGKYAVMWMASELYGVPRYVIHRNDPPTPELDRLAIRTFFLNPYVREYLVPLLESSAAERLAAVVEPAALEATVRGVATGNVEQVDVTLALRMAWVLAVEDGAWGGRAAPEVQT